MTYKSIDKEYFTVESTVDDKVWWPVFINPHHETLESAQKRLQKARDNINPRMHSDQFRIAQFTVIKEILND